MLKFYLARELSSRLDIPLSRWKRWSREFLPPDPLGGLQSGFARQFSLRDAFTVYLAGYLVSGLGYSVPEARQVLQDLDGWLKRDVIDPYLSVAKSGPDAVQQIPFFHVLILPAQRQTQPAFTYRIRCRVDRRALEGGTIWQEQYTEKVIKPGEPQKTGCYPACQKVLPLSAVALQFMEQLAHNSYNTK